MSKHVGNHYLKDVRQVVVIYFSGINHRAACCLYTDLVGRTTAGMSNTLTHRNFFEIEEQGA